MIILSAHKDTVFYPYRYSFSNGYFKGLLDNAIGQLAIQSLLIENVSIRLLEQKNEIGVFMGSHEEFGLNDDFPRLNKKDIVICVDVASSEQYKNIDFSLENISGFRTTEIKTLRDNLEWEGFSIKTKLYNRDKEDEDESWQWIKSGHKVISFIIPIQNGNNKTGWHVDDCTLHIEKFIRAKKGLTRMINYLL